MKHTITFILTIILTVMLLCFVVNANIREAYTDLPTSEITISKNTEPTHAINNSKDHMEITENTTDEFINESAQEEIATQPTQETTKTDVKIESVENNQKIEQDNQAKEEVATKPMIEQENSNVQDETIKVERFDIDYVDEQLYVSATKLNVRSGPGTQYDNVATLSLNDKVHRIGVVDNGWSLIAYNNQELYVYSSYLSKEKIVEPPVKISVAEEMKSRPGMLGRLSIPSVGLDVALFYGDVRDSSQSQRVVDASDSAAYLSESDEYYGQILIADHVHQGFSAIKQSVPGTTEAIIDFGTHVEKWICTRIFIGMNVGSNLVDMNGIGIEGQNDGGICMYTCNFDGSITITFWQKV